MNELGYAEMGKCAPQGVQMIDRNPTVCENIDSKIAMLKKEIERLEASKIELAPLMNMHIRDIRDAMSY